MQTFSELGTPFPLFEAKIEDASDFAGEETCSVCHQRAEICFELGIGCALIVECGKCAATNGLDAYDKCGTPCRKCGSAIPFPETGSQVFCCYRCLREGKAAITKDTEFGMVSWEQAFEGLTSGRPGLKRAPFELVPTDSDWVRVRVPREMMFELLRTPTYQAIQGDSWKFCCKRPMIFVGQWTSADFDCYAPNGDGYAFFQKVVPDAIPGLWESRLSEISGIYAFRCPCCSQFRAHWNIS